MINARPQADSTLTESGYVAGGHLLFLDGLRGLAALYVVLFHFLSLNRPGLPHGIERALLPFHFGHSAVDIFIVLSGFSLMLPVVRDGSLRGGWRGFLVRRARRIMPPYYAALALSCAALVAVRRHPWAGSLHASPDQLAWPDLSLHLLLVHNWSARWSEGFNMALWTVATEWQIYFLLPLLIIPVWRRWGGGEVVTAGFLVGMIPLLLTLMPGPLHGRNLAVACFWYVGLFATGAVGASLVARRVTLGGPRLAAWAVLAAVLYAGTLRLLPAHTGNTAGAGYYLIESLRDGLLGALALCLILYCAARPCAPRRLLELRPFRALGAFSYSLYAIHCAVLEVVDDWGLAHGQSALSHLALKALAVPAAVGLAYLFHLAFERPFLSARRPAGGQGR